MAMVIMNNGAAMQALHETDKNSNRLAKDLKKVASGMKINSAGDGAAEYAISEKMRVMVRSLGQDIENAKKGIDLVKLAEDGMHDIVAELRDMKAMAINSANDHNSETDRAILQKEFAARIESIDEIAATTNYNGKILMDGRYWYKEYEGNISVNDNSVVPASNNINVSNMTTTKKLNNVWGSPKLTRTRIMFGNANTQAKLEAKTTPVDNRVENLFPASPTGRAFIRDYGNVSGYMPDAIESTEKFPREYILLQMPNILQGNFVPPIYKIDNGNVTEYTAMRVPHDGQTVYVKNRDNTYTPCYFSWGGYSGSSIITLDYSDVSYNEKRYMTEFNFSNATINGNPLKFPRDLNNQSITIMCKECEQYIGIKLETGRPAGTGVKYTTRINQYTNGKSINDSIVYAIGLGTDDCTEEDVLRYIFNGIKEANGDNSANYQSDDVILLSKIHSLIMYHDSESGTYSLLKKEQPMVIYNGGIGKLTGGGEEEAQAQSTTPPEPDPPDPPDPDPPEPDPPDPPDPDPPEPDPNPPTPDPPNPDPITPHENDWRDRTRWFEGNPLIIHYGPKANQHLRVYINDMHTKAMGLEGVAVDPIEKALEAIGRLDGALEYALNEITRMGAYQQKLQYTIDNNTIAEENVTRSESIIRDADMAKTMVEYVKDNILTQTAQSMLAQANQNSSAILQLLQ